MADILNKLDFYFTPISIQKIHPDCAINCDLYIKTGPKFILYKNRNLVMETNDFQRLRASAIEEIFIHNNDKKNFRAYTEGNLESILKSEHTPIAKKAEALQESAINVVEDIFKDSRSGQAINRSRELVGHTVDFLIGTPGSFANLLKIRKHDYYTYTHSVNVCTFLVTLAGELGISDKDVLHQIGEGGLLHDLGKSMIPSAIINKSGQLVRGG